MNLEATGLNKHRGMVTYIELFACNHSNVWYNMHMKEITQKTVNQFLDDLRESGKTNMYEATPYIQKKFNITKYEANRFLIKWMETFKERNEHLYTDRAVVEDWKD